MNERTFRRCKRLMIFFNILFLLSGIALVAVGLWVVIDIDSLIAILNFNSLLFVYSSYIAIIVGGITILLSICGCVGAWKENKCLLMIFIGVLTFFLLAEIVALILAFVFTGDLTSLLNRAAVESIKFHYGVSSTVGFAVTQAWDFTQVTASCCGLNNGTDYFGSVFDALSINVQPWPISCCTRNGLGGYVDSTACLSDTAVSILNTNAARGCEEVLRSLISAYSVTVGALAGGVVAIQFLAIIFASCVTSNISKLNRVGSFYD